MQAYTIGATGLTEDRPMTSPITARFPEPDAEALAVSESLTARIRDAIDTSGGWLGFQRYMQMALYEPGLGYYSAGSAKFGVAGDFTTAPEISEWLARSLAAFLSAELTALQANSILELGAGTGALAAELMPELERRGHDSIDYAVLEPSADLRERQQQGLAAANLSARWIDALPEASFRGVVLANEVADALPVARFVKQGGRVLPLGLAVDRGRFEIVPGPEDSELAAAVAGIEADLGQALADGYRSEVCLLLEPWLTEVLGSIAAGGMLLIDYGMPRRDYYRAEQSDGTLICHYRQRAHADYLRWPGLTDLSAWVDFSAVAAVGRKAGFRLGGYTTQAQFLLDSIAGDSALRERSPSPAEASALRRLVLPGEMGERFKLIWLTRGFEAARLPGRDFRSWL